MNLKRLVMIIKEHMDRSSEFVKNKALFGSYPSQEQVEMFENFGVRYFINLTCDGEKKITPYQTKYTYINYPIPDRRVPTDWKSFAQFIIKVGTIIKSLKNGERIYVHCKGGHGRSGIVVACLLCYLYKITPSEALSKTTRYHSRRKEMREKWRKMGSPQTRSQKHFVTKFFEPLYIYKNFTTYFSAGFSNDASIPVKINGLGVFPTATSAFNVFKEPTNDNYIRRLELTEDIVEIRELVASQPIPDDWEEKRESIMFYILSLKFQQNKNLKKSLMNTGLRPIILRSSDPFWGKFDTNGKNMFGKMLMMLRKEFYMSM